MRLRTINESIAVSENYPPGAANDPNAPWNQKSVDYETSKIDGHVWDSEGDQEIPVKIEYTYYERGFTKVITDYSFEYVNPDDANKASSSVDDDIRYEIGEDAGKHEFDV